MLTEERHQAACIISLLHRALYTQLYSFNLQAIFLSKTVCLFKCSMYLRKSYLHF